MRHPLRFSLLLVTAFVCADGRAQVQAPPPPGVTPPQNLRVSPELDLPKPEIEIQKEKTVEPAQPASVPAKKPPAPELKLTIKRFIITGNELFSDEQLQPLVAPYLNIPLTLNDIYLAADKITEHYVNAGFSLALTTIPAQKVDKGVITLEVIEGRLGRVYPEDNTVYSTAQIMRYLRGINTAEAYSAPPLERALLELNAQPGLKTKAVLKPGEFYGRSDLVIKTEEKRWAAALNVDNYGRESSGRIRTTLAAQLNNPFGASDQFQAVALASEEGKLQYNSLAYNLAPFVGGPRLFLSYGQADFKVNPVDGRSRNARVNLEQNLRRNRNETLNVGLGATRVLSDVDLAGQSINATSITYFDISGAYNLLGEKGEVTQMSAGLTSNFDHQAGVICQSATSAACTGVGAKLDIGLLRLQPLAGRFDLLLRLNGAYSPDPLPDTNQFSIGGPGSVRAYPSAELRGESGYVAGADFRYAVLTGPLGLTARVFGDYGTVHVADSIVRSLPFDNASLGAVGVGFDLGYTRHLTAKFDVAWPTITDSNVAPSLPSDDDGGHTFFASVGLNF